MKRTIIFLMALTAALGTAALAAALKISSATEKVIRLKVKKFEFTPGVITVKKGEPLVLDLTSENRTPGFNRPNFGIGEWGETWGSQPPPLHARQGRRQDCGQQQPVRVGHGFGIDVRISSPLCNH